MIFIMKLYSSLNHNSFNNHYCTIWWDTFHASNYCHKHLTLRSLTVYNIEIRQTKVMLIFKKLNSLMKVVYTKNLYVDSHTYITVFIVNVISFLLKILLSKLSIIYIVHG